MNYLEAAQNFEQYLDKKQVRNDFAKFNGTDYVLFYNDYFEFKIKEINDNPFIECENVELGNMTVFSFYVPEKIEDFMSILDVLIV